MTAAAAALLLALAAYAYFFIGNFGHLHELTALRPPSWRRQRYRVWIAKSWLLFAFPALVGLALMEQSSALVQLPSAFVPLASSLGYPAPLLGEGIVTGLAAGSLIGGVWTLIRRRKGKLPAMLGDFSMLLPQDAREGWFATCSAITAGITEEVYFRLAVPLALTTLTGNAIAGFVVATILFVFAHRYQRLIGMAATGLTGALFAYLYLQTGSLWVAIVAHVVVDMNGLVLRPALAGMMKRRAN